MRNCYRGAQGDVRKIHEHYGMNRVEFVAMINKWYMELELSAVEVSERLVKETGYVMSPRSVQRSLYVPRSGAEGFRLAARKGRVQWKKSETKSIKRKKIVWSDKYRIAVRDKWTCQEKGCGFHHKDDSFQFIEFDHIVPLYKGGTSDDENLRVLCVECHKNKTSKERKEFKTRGGAYSGRDPEMRKKF